MAPQFYDVDVWYDRREIPDQMFRIVIDWHPDHAERVGRILDGHILAAHYNNQAVAPDLRLYSLHAFDVAPDGRRGAQVWVWRITVDPDDQQGGSLWRR